MSHSRNCQSWRIAFASLQVPSKDSMSRHRKFYL
jgi:hypothetical protein